MSELLQLLTGAKPYPIPIDRARRASFETPEDGVDVSYCPKCERDGLDLSQFYVRADGRCSSWCKACTRALAAEQRQNRKESKCA